jgi:hypothetical protein
MSTDHGLEPQNLIADAIDGAEEMYDPLDGLAEKTVADPGAPFMAEALEALGALKKDSRAAFEALRSRLKKAGCRVTALDNAISEETGETGGRGPTQADILIGLARTAELFHTPDSVGFADLDINGHRETWPIRSKGFRRWLARCFFEETGGAPSSEALQSALNVIEAKAHFDAPERVVFVRVDGLDGKLYLEDRIYNAKDFDRTLVLDDRTVLTAKKITEFLRESGDRFQKTIVFCVDQEHAARMRQALINENADLVAENQRYVMRITGGDKEGQDQLGNFIDPESKYPVLVTTSRLLSAGVDAQTCRLIVLDREVHSMTEFKQIVGRGTRVHEDTKKFFFTPIDFRGATSHFADPDFDGDPVQIYEPGDGDPIAPPDDVPPPGDDAIPPTPGEDETVVDAPGLPLPPGGPIRKIYVDGVGARILAERVEYLDENGKLVTESLRDSPRRR